MKRNALVAGMLLLALCVGAAPASAERFALGGYGGYQWPIVQDDAEGGGLFGVKGKAALLPWLEIEPNITWFFAGDTETDSGDTIESPGVTAYQLNGTLTMGGVFGLTGGLGWAALDLPTTGSENKFTFNFGFEIELDMGPVTLDVSPRFLAINHADGATRKHGLIMAGINYWF